MGLVWLTYIYFGRKMEEFKLRQRRVNISQKMFMEEVCLYVQELWAVADEM